MRSRAEQHTSTPWVKVQNWLPHLVTAGHRLSHPITDPITSHNRHVSSIGQLATPSVQRFHLCPIRNLSFVFVPVCVHIHITCPCLSLLLTLNWEILKLVVLLESDENLGLVFVLLVGHLIKCVVVCCGVKW